MMCLCFIDLEKRPSPVTDVESSCRHGQRLDLPPSGEIFNHSEEEKKNVNDTSKYLFLYKSLLCFSKAELITKI